MDHPLVWADYSKKIEVSSYFNYKAMMLQTGRITEPQKPLGRRIEDVPVQRLEALSSGTSETANWTEWMATDMSRLARSLAVNWKGTRAQRALFDAADQADGQGILSRLAIFGRGLCTSVRSFEDAGFERFATHRSDVVRQWAVYAVNDPARPCSIKERFRRTLRFAADPNMTVRECAWMAFRPYVAANLTSSLRLLSQSASCDNGNVRRFLAEVCRPRSVWGKHIQALKEEPGLAAQLLDRLNRDDSRYVRLSVGNWLNDASKTRPDWVLEICARWSAAGDRNTTAIVRRGLRTLAQSSGTKCSVSELSFISDIRPKLGRKTC